MQLLTSAATAIASTAHWTTSWIMGWFSFNQSHMCFPPLHSPPRQGRIIFPFLWNSPVYCASALVS
nr:MAG TPA: hypothetical protein [Caudoviricetes sp.]